MSVDLHTIETIPGMAPAANDRLTLGVLKGVAFAAGGSAGAAVTLTVNATLIPGLKLPPTYAVFGTTNEDTTVKASAKTAAGFTVTISPRLAATTLAAGTIDLLVVA